MIYLDNAATAFPKPREVLEWMVDLYASKGVSPGGARTTPGSRRTGFRGPQTPLPILRGG